MLSGILSDQQHLGPLLANAAGLGPVEAATAEACCGSGGAALRWGFLAVASGAYETVVVCGAEQMTHRELPDVTKGLAMASHWPTEGGCGETFVSLNGRILAAYMARYGVSHEAFAPFAVTAHTHAATAAHATLRGRVTTADYAASRVLTPPVRLLDASPVCDGAAAVVLTSSLALARGARGGSGAVVRIAGSAAASDTLPVAQRPDPLELRAVALSTAAALRSAGASHADVDLFELHDAYSIMACASLENAGFARRGEGTDLAASGALGLKGSLPIATFGGLKARGHPVGATGVYQAAEVHLQLTRRAGANQVAGAEVAVTQNIGGAGASVFTHVLVRE
jgi:acetyl-CoA C-acetyltransferase